MEPATLLMKQETQALSNSHEFSSALFDVVFQIPLKYLQSWEFKSHGSENEMEL